MVFYYSARAAITNLDIDEISSYEMEEKIGSGGDLSAKVALGSNSTGASYNSSSENTKKWQQNVSLEEKLNNALNKDKKYGKVAEKITDINEETKFIKIDCNLDYGVMPFLGLNSNLPWSKGYGETARKERIRAFWATANVTSNIKSPWWKFWVKDEVKKLDLYLIGSLSNLPEGSFLRNEYDASESKEIMFNYPSDPAYLTKIVLEDRGLTEQQLDEIQNEAESNNAPDDPNYPLLSYAKSMTNRASEPRGAAAENRLVGWRFGTHRNVTLIAAIVENREAEGHYEILARPIYIR